MSLFRKKSIVVALVLSLAPIYSYGNKVSEYAYESTSDNPQFYREFKDGDFNPYWFQYESVKSYAYESTSDNPQFYREFKDGDFNPYWFQEQEESFKLTKN